MQRPERRIDRFALCDFMRAKRHVFARLSSDRGGRRKEAHRFLYHLLGKLQLLHCFGSNVGVSNDRADFVAQAFLRRLILGQQPQAPAERDGRCFMPRDQKAVEIGDEFGVGHRAAAFGVLGGQQPIDDRLPLPVRRAPRREETRGFVVEIAHVAIDFRRARKRQPCRQAKQSENPLPGDGRKTLLQSGDEPAAIEGAGDAEHCLLDDRESDVRRRAHHIDRRPRRGEAPVLRLGFGAIDECRRKRQKIFMTEGRRQGAPLPFPVRAFDKEQRVAIDDGGQRADGDEVARKTVRAHDQNFFDEFGIGEIMRAPDERPDAIKREIGFAIGGGRPVFEKITFGRAPVRPLVGREGRENPDRETSRDFYAKKIFASMTSVNLHKKARHAVKSCNGGSSRMRERLPSAVTFARQCAKLLAPTMFLRTQIRGFDYGKPEAAQLRQRRYPRHA